MAAFLALLFAYVLSQFYRAFLAVVATDLSRDLGLGPAELGMISAVWFIGFAFAQFPVGWALDRFGPRRTIAGFMTGAVGGAGLLSLSTGYAGALASMALIGIGCAPVLMGSMYLFGRIYPVHRFTMMSSLMLGLAAAGNLLGATPLALMAEALGWRTAMAGIAAITGLAVAIVFAVVRDPPVLATETPASALAGLSDVAAIRSLWPMLPLTAMGYAVVISTRALWIGPFFGEVHAFDATARGNAALAMAAAMALGALAYAPIERLLGHPKPAVAFGSAATAACFLALGTFGNGHPMLSIILLTAVGFLGMTYAVFMSHACRFFPPALLGRGVTFMNFGFIGGAGLVQWLSGLFVAAGQRAGEPASVTFGHLFLIFGAVLLAATAVYAAAPRGPEASER
jgi:MFS family permease